MTPRPLLDALERAAAVVVATGGAVLAAVVAAFLVPLRIGGVPAPVCFLVAVVGNVVAVRLAYRWTGLKWAMAAPGLAWFLTMIPLSVRKTEGDLVIADSWIGVGVLFIGAMALAVAAFLVIVGDPAALPTPRQPTVPNDPETVTRHA